MHHGMIDRTWWQWQQANTANYAAYNSTSRGSTNFTVSDVAREFVADILTDGLEIQIDAPMANGNLGPVMTVRDMLNTTSGFLCYTYE
jgi:tyrosinase